MRIMSRDSYSFYLSFGYNLPCLFLVLLLCFENLPVIFSLHVIFRRSTKDLSHTAHMQDSAVMFRTKISICTNIVVTTDGLIFKNKTEGQLNNNSFLTTPSTINSSQTLSELSKKSVTVAATTSPHQLTTLMNSSRRKNTDKGSFIILRPIYQFIRPCRTAQPIFCFRDVNWHCLHHFNLHMFVQAFSRRFRNIESVKQFQQYR